MVTTEAKKLRKEEIKNKKEPFPKLMRAWASSNFAKQNCDQPLAPHGLSRFWETLERNQIFRPLFAFRAFAVHFLNSSRIHCYNP
jgi:hypothetical protein